MTKFPKLKNKYLYVIGASMVSGFLFNSNVVLAQIDSEPVIHNQVQNVLTEEISQSAISPDVATEVYLEEYVASEPTTHLNITVKEETEADLDLSSVIPKEETTDSIVEDSVEMSANESTEAQAQEVTEKTSIEITTESSIESKEEILPQSVNTEDLALESSIDGNQLNTDSLENQQEEITNQWVFSDEDMSWTYFDELGNVSKVVSDKGYFIEGVEQKDSHISINGKAYYFDKDGQLAKNNWVYSNGMHAWFKPDENGLLVNEVTPWGHYVNGLQLFDKLVNVLDQNFYFEPQEWGGTMAFDKWSYSPTSTSWYFSDWKGVVSRLVTPESYIINDVEQKDKHISIEGLSYYYDSDGKQLRDNQAYSSSMNAHFRAGVDGVLNYEVTPWGHYVNGHQKFDTTININDKDYYFEPQEWGGTMAFNKWSFSPLLNSWYYSKPNGTISTYVTPNEYKVNGVVKKDAHVSILGTSYYYLPTGKRHIGGNIFSNQLNAWFATNNMGVLTQEVTPWGYYLNGAQQFDSLVSVGTQKYYFEPQGWGGTMALNKWSYSPINKYWYISDVNGIVTKRDKVGPILPSYVSLDRGQWRMYTLAQDGWESGCWLRTAASGINSAGGNASPWSLINEITRTDDPRTGMLSHPSIVNNWNLGGAYSAMWPEALVPVVQKHVPNAADLTGASFEDIKRELANGNTVQVYFSWAAPNIRLNTGNGPFYASRDYHSYLLTGYNSTGFFHQEHWGNNRNNHVSFSKLQWQYNSYGKKAISYRTASIQP